MKTSLIFFLLAVVLSVAAQGQRGGNRGFRGGFRGIGRTRGRGRGRPGRNNNGAARPPAATTSAKATPTPITGGTTPATGNGGNGNNNGNNGNNNNNGGNNNAGNGNNNAGNGNNNAGNGGAAGGGNNQDPQKSLTLDPRVIAKGFANDGQDQPVAGQVSSLTSTNNFINFCLTVNTAITDGKQITTGSCNPAPIGVIPAVTNMPSSKFVFPKNGATIQADTQFTVQMAVKNLQTGNFVNAQTNYFAAPQQLNRQGDIVGHTHVVIEDLPSLDSTQPTDPQKFRFFKGVNGAAVGGVVTADVTVGVPAGTYRVCSINTSANHTPVIGPVAQHGSFDDCVYFTATANGQPAGGAAGGAAGNGNANNGANGGATQGGTQGATQGATRGATRGGARGGARQGGRRN